MLTTEVHLYRGVRKEEYPEGAIIDGHAVQGVLYPLFEKKTYLDRKGKQRTRQRDVRPYAYEGKMVVDPGGGTSLFDKSEAFGTTDWWYFKLPKGTVVPESLRVRHTGYNSTFNAEHYQVEAASEHMPVDAFKGALDNLARNAVEKLYRDAHGK